MTAKILVNLLKITAYFEEYEYRGIVELLIRTS